MKKFKDYTEENFNDTFFVIYDNCKDVLKKFSKKVNGKTRRRLSSVISQIENESRLIGYILSINEYTVSVAGYETQIELDEAISRFEDYKIKNGGILQ